MGNRAWWPSGLMYNVTAVLVPGLNPARDYKAPQTNPDSHPRSEPALELHSRAASSVGITSPFQRSQHRKQFRRKADKKFRWEFMKKLNANNPILKRSLNLP